MDHELIYEEFKGMKVKESYLNLFISLRFLLTEMNII